MKRIAISVITMVMALTVGAYATTAAWTDTVQVTNNVIQTGTADLKVSTRENAGEPDPNYNQGPRTSHFLVTGLVPGATAPADYTFSLLNDGDVDFSLVGQVTTATFSGTEPADLSSLRLQFFEHGTTTPIGSEFTLPQWQGAARSLETLGAGLDRHYDIVVRLLNSAANDWQGQTLTLTFDVTGTSVPPVTP